MLSIWYYHKVHNTYFISINLKVTKPWFEFGFSVTGYVKFRFSFTSLDLYANLESDSCLWDIVETQWISAMYISNINDSILDDMQFEESCKWRVLHTVLQLGHSKKTVLTRNEQMKIIIFSKCFDYLMNKYNSAS